MTALDDLVDRLPPPTLVKIDVEGAEPDVLRGMTRTIERFSPVIVCEIHGGGRAACEELLLRAGYAVRNIEREPGGMPHLLAMPGARVGRRTDQHFARS